LYDLGAGMVHLYHWEPNANSGKPMLTLAEKGVPFESHYTDLLKFDQHQPDYLKINPDGTIPVMVHGSHVMTESTPIMEYVDDEFPGPPLKPADTKERWRMRWWMRFFDSYFAPSLSMIGWAVFVRPCGSVRVKNSRRPSRAFRSSPAASPGARRCSTSSARRSSPSRSGACSI